MGKRTTSWTALRTPDVRSRCVRRIASGVVSMGVAGAMALGPALAYADPDHAYESASITVTSQANEDATYDAYQVFAADITANDEASHVSWSSDAARLTVLAFFDGLSGDESYSAWLVEQGYTQEGAAENAQNAAEFIAERIAADSNDVQFGGEPAAKVGGSFADRLARAVVSSNMAKTTTGTDGVVSGGTEGYYLIVASSASINDDEGGSAPMWVPLGGSLNTIEAKEASPSISFSVKEDKTGQFGRAADSNTSQDLEFKIQATVPDNIGAYCLYHDRYVITLPAGMSTAGTAAGDADVSAGSLRVFVGETDVTSSAAITTSGKVMTVEFSDLKAISGLDVAKGDAVVITYSAHLDEGAVLGSVGNETTVARTYTKDPVSLADGAATVQSVKNYGYQAQLVKIDKSNHSTLPDAVFTISASTNQGDVGTYVQADGSLGQTAYEFRTDANGEFVVPGLDEGVYTIAEAHAPEGYQLQDAAIVLTVESSLDQDGGLLTSFGAGVSGGEAADVVGDESTRVLSEDASSGLAVIQAVDDRAFEMPLTGLRGNAGIFALATALGGSGASALLLGVRRRFGNTRS